MLLLLLLLSNLEAQEAGINESLSTLSSDFTAFFDTIRQYLRRHSDDLAAVNLPQSPRTRIAVTFDDLQRLGDEFRRGLSDFGVGERTVWKRLIGDELTRGFYQRLRSDMPDFSTHQLRELAENSPRGNSARTNYELEDDWPDGVVSQLASMEGRYAMLNADVPTMDLSFVSDHVTGELSHYADEVDVDTAIRVKVEDLLTKFDDLTRNVESLRSNCGPQSENDLNDLIR